MFFGIFVLNRADLIIFCLNQGIDFINFCLKKGIYSWTIKQPTRMFYELNYSKIFTKSFGLNVLNRVSKIRILS